MDQEALNLLSNNIDVKSQVDLWLQIFLLVVMIFYTIFAFLVYKQIGILNSTIKTPRGPLLANIAKAHLGASIGILLLTILAIIF